MVDVYRRKQEGEVTKLALFSKALLAKFNDSDLSRLAEIVSDELNITNDNETVRLSSRMFPAEFWTRLDESAKMRSENRFLESIKEGEYVVSSDKCIRGALGTWCSNLISNFVMKEEIILTLLVKLDSSKREEQDYVFNYFGASLLYNLDGIGEGYQQDWAISTFKKGLEAGDKRFYDIVRSAINYHSVVWKDSLNDAFESYQEAGEVPTVEPEDIPF